MRLRNNNGAWYDLLSDVNIGVLFEAAYNNGGGLMQKIDSVLTGLCDKCHMYSGVGLSQ